MWVSIPGYLQIIHFSRIFSMINHPAIGVPPFMEIPRDPHIYRVLQFFTQFPDLQGLLHTFSGVALLVLVVVVGQNVGIALLPHTKSASNKHFAAIVQNNSGTPKQVQPSGFPV